ncbi:histone H1.10 isoform X2 [Lampetra planeri]
MGARVTSLVSSSWPMGARVSSAGLKLSANGSARFIHCRWGGCLPHRSASNLPRVSVFSSLLLLFVVSSGPPRHFQVVVVPVMSSVEAMDSLEVAPVAPELHAEAHSDDQDPDVVARKGKARKAKVAIKVGVKPSPTKPPYLHVGGGGGSIGAGGKKKKKKKNQPGKYSRLVIDVIRALGERGGSSLARVYAEARKVEWFDQEHGRTYLKYSVKALVQNDTLLQVKGTGANGSFKLNKNKLEKKAAEEKGKSKPPAPTSSKPVVKKSVVKAEPKALRGIAEEKKKKKEQKQKSLKEKNKKAKHSKKSVKTSVGKSVSKAIAKGKKPTKVSKVKRV